MATTDKVNVLATNLDAALKADLREITATQFTRKQYVFPMSTDEFNASFPATISVFSDRAPTTNGGTVTNMVIANQVSCPFLLTGVSVTLIPDTIRAAIDGMVTDTTQAGFVAGTTPAWDRIAATATNPLIGPADVAVANTTSRAAVFKWGSCSQDFAQAFAQAYNLRFLLGCKWEVFDEPLASLVSFDGQAGLTDGSGASVIDMAAAIRKANDRAISVLGIPPFFPRTVEQSPALTADAPVQRAILAPAPTAPENTGSVSWKNETGGFFALDLPILLTPYTTIMMELHNNTGDLVYYPRMRQEATAEDAESVLFPGADGSLTDTAGATGAIISLRKYGTLSIMTTLHGFNLESSAVSDYANLVASGGFSQYLSMYSGDMLLGPQIAAANASRKLEGVAGAKRLAGGPR